MGDNERRILWAYLDREGEGEVQYSVFDDFMAHMRVPTNFWVMYVEPFRVERTGYGDAWGNPEIDYVDGVPTERRNTEINAWMYFLSEEDDSDEWDVVAKMIE